MSRVVHFEIHADNPERAIQFYSGIFGWKFTKWEGPMDYWLIETGPKEEMGINGGLLRRQCVIDGQAVIAYVCTIDCKDLDSILKQAQTAGATVAMPKMPIPNIGWLAYLKDTEGNIFGVMQRDPNAKMCD